MNLKHYKRVKDSQDYTWHYDEFAKRIEIMNDDTLVEAKTFENQNEAMQWLQENYSAATPA